MWSNLAALACALDLLGRSAASFPPIEFVDERPADVPPEADAFVRRGDETIYLLTMPGSSVYEARRHPNACGDVNASRRLAGVLVHEEWHVRHGPDERGAYEAQLMALRLMNAGPGNRIYASVVRARAAALERMRIAEASRAAPAVEPPAGRQAGLISSRDRR